jgi:TPR repeat protein
MKVHVKILLALVLNMNLMASDIDDGDIALKNQDPVKAMQFYQRACDAGNKTGCKKLELAKSDFDKKLNEYADKLQNYIEVLRVMEKACDEGNANECFKLGIEYETTPYHELIKSFEKAAQYYKKACDGQKAEGCHNLGVLHYNGKVVCDDQKAESCHSIELMGYSGKVVNIKGMELVFASHYYEKACKLGIERSCIAYNVVGNEIRKK